MPDASRGWSSLDVLLDASVLIPAALSDTLLRAAEAELYRLRWSDAILEEVRRNLVRAGKTTLQGAERRIAAMRQAFPEALVLGFEPLVVSMTNAEEDRHVLAAAAFSGVDVIVTSNLRDFPERALRPVGIEAQGPDQFLLQLFSVQPTKIVQLIHRQAADLRAPRKTVQQILDAYLLTYA